MASDDVTHAVIVAKIDQLSHRVDALDARVADEANSVRSIHVSLDRMAERQERLMETGSVWRENIATIAVKADQMSIMQKDQHESILRLHDRLSNVEAAENQRIGRDGVWRAIMRSPVAPWLATLGAWIAAVWAYLKDGGGP